jgi:cupin superfamily acireductone dioxygenase involved in methionine salvage
MKKQTSFHLQLCVFFSLIIIVVLLIEFGIRNLRTEFSINKTLLENETEVIHTLILGTSQLSKGINAELLEDNTANLASSSQHHNVDFALLKEIVPNLSNLKIVFLELSYAHLELQHSTERFWKNSIYYSYFNVNLFNRRAYFKDKLLYISNPEYFSRLLKMKFIQKEPSSLNDKAFDTLGFDGIFKRNNYKNIDKINVNGLENKENLAVYEYNTSHFIKMLTYLENKNLNIVILSPPTHKLYVENRNNNIVKRRDSFINKLKNKYPKITFLNLENDTITFRTKDYRDFNHLNPDGAKKLTAILQRTLDSIN